MDDDVHARLAATADLTGPELMALRCAANGLTGDETAEVLCKSRETVKTQLQDVRMKLAAKNTAHAVAIAVRHRLIP